MTSTPIPISTKPSSRSVFFPDFPARKVRAAPPIAVLRGKQESPAKAARHGSSSVTGRLLFIDSHNQAKFLQKTPFTACPQEKSASTRFRAPRHTPSVFRLFGNIAGQTTGKTAPEISGQPAFFFLRACFLGRGRSRPDAEPHPLRSGRTFLPGVPTDASVSACRGCGAPRPARSAPRRFSGRPRPWARTDGRA